MSAENTQQKEMGVLGKITGIFASPRETFESINQKPTWLVPFVIVLITFLVFQFLTLDIQLQDRMAILEARDMPAAQFEAAKSQMEGPMKYMGFIIGPIFMLIVLVILSAIFLFTGKTVMGGESKFKNVFSVVVWSGLIGVVGMLIKLLMILPKGTMQGVTTSLAIMLPTPEMGQKASFLHRLLSRFDIFTIWQIILWIIAFAVVFKFATKKSATMVISLWVIYIIVAVVMGGFLGGMF